MKKDILAGTLLLLMLATIAVGCRARAPAPNRGDTSIQAVAFNPETLYYVAGGGLMVLGVLTAAFGGRITGVVLFAGGAGMAWFGQTLVRYQWLSLVAVLLAAAVAAVIAYDRWKARRALRLNQEATEALAEVIQKKPEGDAIKAGVAALGAEVESKVRAVVTPIKEKLARVGKL